jgi:hypothetical protein
LTPGGLFLCWLPLALPTEVFDSILATALAAFPHVTLWSVPGAGHSFVQLVCSREKQRFDPEHIRNELSRPEVQPNVAGIKIDSSERFLGFYRCDEIDIRRYLSNAVVNTDLKPFVEFSTRPIPTAISQAPLARRLFGVARRESLADHLNPAPPPTPRGTDNRTNGRWNPPLTAECESGGHAPATGG